MKQPYDWPSEQRVGEYVLQQAPDSHARLALWVKNGRPVVSAAGSAYLHFGVSRSMSEE